MLDGVSDLLQGEGRFGVEPRSQNVQLRIAAATWRIQTSDSAFCQISLVLVSVRVWRSACYLGE